MKLRGVFVELAALLYTAGATSASVLPTIDLGGMGMSSAVHAEARAGPNTNTSDDSRTEWMGAAETSTGAYYSPPPPGSSSSQSVTMIAAGTRASGASGEARITSSGEYYSHDATGSHSFYGTAQAYVSDFAVTIGTNTDYPAGTPLSLEVSSYLSTLTGTQWATGLIDWELSIGGIDVTRADPTGLLAVKAGQVIPHASWLFKAATIHGTLDPPERGTTAVMLEMTLVPEPFTFSLLALGGLAAMGRRRR